MASDQGFKVIGDDIYYDGILFAKITNRVPMSIREDAVSRLEPRYPQYNYYRASKR